MPTKLSPSVASDAEKTQLEKFKEAARKLECDEDEAHWDERLKKVAKAQISKGEARPKS